jgi:hypothetical protein
MESADVCKVLSLRSEHVIWCEAAIWAQGSYSPSCVNKHIEKVSQLVKQLHLFIFALSGEHHASSSSQQVQNVSTSPLLLIKPLAAYLSSTPHAWLISHVSSIHNFVYHLSLRGIAQALRGPRKQLA